MAKKKYKVLLVGDTCKIHAYGCAHTKREKRIESDWEIEAENSQDAIEKNKQFLYENYGGQGSYKNADNQALNDALCFDNEIINCAKD